MSTSRKQGNRPISESPLLRAFAASGRSTTVSNAGTRSAGTCSSVMLSAEPIQVATQNDFDVEHGLQLPTAKKKKLIPVASRYAWLKKDLSTADTFALLALMHMQEDCCCYMV